MQLAPRTYLPSEQELAESELIEAIDYVRLVYGVILNTSDICEIARSSNEVSAHNSFQTIANVQDVFVPSIDVYALIIKIVCAHNDFMTLLSFANCVGDTLALRADSISKPIDQIWPKALFGSYESSMNIYLMSNLDFKQEVREACHRKLNFVSNLGAFVTLNSKEAQLGLSNLEVTPVERLCSWIDLLGRKMY